MTRDEAAERLRELAVDLPATQIALGEERAAEIEVRARAYRDAIYRDGESATHAGRVADIETEQHRQDIARDEASVWAAKDEVGILQFLIDHDLCD